MGTLGSVGIAVLRTLSTESRVGSMVCGSMLRATMGLIWALMASALPARATAAKRKDAFMFKMSTKNGGWDVC